MFEKILVTALKSASAVIYVIIMIALFAFPVSFIIHAFLPPVFTLSKIETSVVGENDSFLGSSDETTDVWHKIDYYITASSGKFSPYEYTIEEVTLQNDEFLSFADGYKVFIDEPSYFTKDITDEIVISLYINSNEEFDINSVCKEAQFKTLIYEKGFGEFKVKYGNGNLWK